MTGLVMIIWAVIALAAILMIEHRLARIQKTLQRIAENQVVDSAEHAPKMRRVMRPQVRVSAS